MYIAKLHIQNFRCFQDTEIEFKPGLNVIIGENNAGKTALLSALRLVLDRGSISLTHHDFNYEAFQKSEPPSITVTATVRSDSSDTPEDRAVVATWLTRTGREWEAALTFVYELAPEHHEAYGQARQEIDGSPEEQSRHAFERMQERKYTARYFGGDPANRLTAEPEWLSHFQAHHLDAIRDAERDLHSGRAKLLRGMLHRVLDAHPPVPGSPPPDQATKDERRATRVSHQKAFRAKSKEMVQGLTGRLHLDHLFGLARRTWAKTAGTLGLGGHLTERDLLDALLLHLDRTRYQHPVTHGGLGYNNLLYVALVLASLNPTDDEEPHRERLFHALFVEEPEAHLHPALQYRFLSFLKRQLDDDARTGRRGSRQLFLSSHSTQVTSAVGLDALVCLHLDEEGTPHVAYPGRAFSDTAEGQASKAYVERFLDATKSALLFARSALFVEGIAEHLLIPRLADFVLGESEEPDLLDRNYVAVVRVDGVTFKHFLPLFGIGTGEERVRYGLLTRRVACITDGDPSCDAAPDAPEADPDDMLDGESGEHDGGVEATTNTGPAKRTKRVACWHYQPGAEPSAVSKGLRVLAAAHPDRLVVGVAQQTFEYDIAHANPDAAFLVSDAMPTRARRMLRGLCDHTHDGQEGAWAKWRPAASRALTAYAKTGTDPDLLRRATIATYYLCAAEGAKGAHASALAATLADHLARSLDDPTRATLVLPEYAVDALRWVCHHEPPACWTAETSEAESLGVEAV